jgi:hypothetical protein
MSSPYNTYIGLPPRYCNVIYSAWSSAYAWENDFIYFC